MISAALLDLDGTLVDSLPALEQAYATFLEEHSVLPSSEEFASWNGPPLAVVVAGLRQAHRLTAPQDELLARYQEILWETYSASTSPSRGAEALLGWLESHSIPVAVVTSAPADLARAVLEQLGPTSRTLLVIGSEDVPAGRGKPAPDAYGEALRRLGVGASNAIALEDSAHGVTAAVGAGLRCLGIAESDRAVSLRSAGATAVGPDLDWARTFLSALHAGRECVPVAASSVTVVSRYGSSPTTAYAAAIETAWQEALAERPALTDDAIVSVLGWSRRDDDLEIAVQQRRYREYIAQRAGVQLGVFPLGVSGLVTLAPSENLASRVVFAQRSPDVTQYPGLWELVPSGGVNGARVAADGVVDASAQLLEELHEELGLTADRVRSLRPLGLLEDMREPGFDLAFHVEVAASEDEIRAGLWEYSTVAFVPTAETEEFIKARAAALVPTVSGLWHLWNRAPSHS